MKWQADQQTTWDPANTALRLLVLAAHPDDETIGASVLLARFPLSYVVYLTDGAPLDSRFWTSGPYNSREDYAKMRRKEATQSLECAGVCQERTFWLGGMDQNVVFEMQFLAAKLASLLRTCTPKLLITHPYEGGHPDHDSAALITRLAVSQLTEARPEMVEMTSYHARAGQCVTGEFLNSEPASELTFEFSEKDRKRKQKMLDAYVSQRLLLASFGTDQERFRKAPEYDFSMPPHDGKLWYEYMGWPMTGAQWRELAAAAISEVESHSCR